MRNHKKVEKFKVYTDGACEPNPGFGGFCAVIFKTGDITPSVVIKGGCKQTTNNRMEIMGVLETLKYIKDASFIDIFTDSQYVSNSINIWLDNWKRRRETKANMDLWDEIWELKKKHHVRATWIKGHNGNFYNEYADSISLDCVDTVKRGKRKSFRKVEITK